MDEAWRFRETIVPHDAHAVQRLVEASGVFSEEEARVAAELVTTTLDGSETYSFLLAEDSAGALIGYTCFERIPLSAVAFDLYWIAVARERRGSGLALDLMQRTTALAKAAGGTQIFAETSSRSPYAAARAFYAKTGFEVAARFESFYAPGDDKLVFRRWL